MDTITNRFLQAAKWLLYILAALLPLWFVPIPIGVEVGREITFGVIIIAAALLWLLAVLTGGEIRFRLSPLLWFGGAFLVVVAISTIFSRSPLYSALFSDATAEKLSTVALGLLLLFVTSIVLRTRAEAVQAVLILLGAGAVAALISAIQLLFDVSVFKIFASFAAGKEFNVVGTVNGLMLFFASLFSVSLGIIASVAARDWPRWARWGVMGGAALYFLNLLLVNFRTSWIVLLVASVFLFGFVFKGMRSRYQSLQFEGATNARAALSRVIMGDRRYIMALVILALSLVMIFVRGPILKEVGLSTEVSPAFKSTWSVTAASWKEGIKPALIGSGPGTFGFLWSQYRDAALNLTPFWNARFNQGDSWVATNFSTLGILGAIAFILFLGAAAFLFLKLIVVEAQSDLSFVESVFLGFVVIVAAAFLYGSNFTMAVMLFFLIGLLVALLSTARTADESVSVRIEVSESEVEEWSEGRKGSGFWSIGEREIVLGSPWAVFLSSLVTVLLLALGVAALYFEVGNFRSALVRQSGVTALNEGRVDEAIAEFKRSLSIGGNSYIGYQLLLQARLAKVGRVLQRAAGGENVQQVFQSEVASTIEDARSATRLHPGEPFLWRSHGALYALITPFIQGAERFAEENYLKAISLDPKNPTLWVELGQARLGYADRLQLEINQTSGAERTARLEARTAALDSAAEAFKKAGELKPDFASAHFLLAQTTIRSGNLRGAIEATERAKFNAPFDVGVAFQLGLLYFQSGDLNKSREEFERAVSLNSSYSNARYFLGLIYDLQGLTTQAIEQFKEIEKFNPDNQEVKLIIQNLEAGKAALSGIVPPAPPPAQRSQAPVQ